MKAIRQTFFTKLCDRPYEDISVISKKHQYFNHTQVRTDLVNPNFRKDNWDDFYVDSVCKSEHNNMFFDEDVEFIHKQIDIAKRLELNEKDLSIFIENFKFFKNDLGMDIEDRLNIISKVKVDDDVKNYLHEFFNTQKEINEELLKRGSGIINETKYYENVGSNNTFSINLDPILFKNKEDLILPRKFFMEDLNNLYTQTKNRGEERVQYIKDGFTEGYEMRNELLPCFENINIKKDTREKAMDNFFLEFDKYYKDVSESINYMSDITAHPSINEIVDTLSSLFIKLTTEDLNVLIEFISRHEFFTLCCLEPFFVCVLGNALIFKIMLPLHKKGILTLLMKRVVIDIKIKKQTVVEYLQWKLLEHRGSIIRYSGMLLIGILGGEVSKEVETICDPVIEPEKKILLSEKIRGRPEPEGFKGELGEQTSEFRSSIKRTGVEIGRFVGTFSKGVKDGVAEEFKEDVADVVEVIENTEFRRRN
jgi:hypothetical protein